MARNTPQWFRKTMTCTNWPQMPQAHGPFGKDRLTAKERQALEGIPLFINVQTRNAIREAHALGGRALSYVSFMDTYVHTEGFENGTARVPWDPKRPQILLMDDEGRFVNTPMDDTWRMWRYLVCNNTREYVEMALEMVHRQMKNGADGLFIDNSDHRRPCYGHGAPVYYSTTYRQVIAGIARWTSPRMRDRSPEELYRLGQQPQFPWAEQTVDHLPRHRHLYPDKSHDEAYRKLLEAVRKAVRSYGSDKVIVVNGMDFADLADAGMIESYIYSWAWKGKSMTWDQLKKTADKWRPYIKRGGKVLALSYIGNTDRSPNEDALHAYSAAVLSEFMWSDYGTCRGRLGGILRRLNLGKRLTDMESSGPVDFAFFENGLAVVNGSSRQRTVEILGPSRFKYSALRNLIDGRRIPREKGKFRVPIPAHSGRVLTALPSE